MARMTTENTILDLPPRRWAAPTSLDRGIAAARAIAWSGFVCGVLSGALMGLWTFDGPLTAPSGFADYGDTARRLLRLGHIAWFGIGFLNLLLLRELPVLALDDTRRRGAVRLMAFANVALPLLLMAAAFWAPLKYLLPVPVSAVLAALVLAARGCWPDRAGNTQWPARRRAPLPEDRKGG